MRFAALLLLLVVLGCGYAKSNGAPTPAFQSTEIVASSDVCMNVDTCAAFAPYVRAFDDLISQPVWWLVSTTGRACTVSPQVFTRAEALYGTPVACAWRARRRL